MPVNRSASTASSITLNNPTYPPSRDIERGRAPPTFIPAPGPSRRTTPPKAQVTKKPTRGRIFLTTFFSPYVLAVIMACIPAQSLSYFTIVLGRYVLGDAARAAVQHAGVRSGVVGAVVVGTTAALVLVLLWALLATLAGTKEDGTRLRQWNGHIILWMALWSLLGLFVVQGVGALVLNAAKSREGRMVVIDLSPGHVPAPGDITLNNPLTGQEIRLVFKVGAVGTAFLFGAVAIFVMAAMNPAGCMCAGL